ncbi:hypothetical protein DRH14_03120 [Candidatus Shapirobacteria bacterium]|nr:MAG: hypothetical protein DRH14_03120 [Candidatus Shapirobacteria bacterium]
MIKKKKSLRKKEKETVWARVQAYGDDFELSIGGSGVLSKEDLLRNIRDETKIGKQIIRIQMEYLRDLVNGNIYKMLDD